MVFWRTNDNMNQEIFNCTEAADIVVICSHYITAPSDATK